MLQRTYLHSGWEFAEKSWPGARHATIQTDWLPAQVPGHVHLDLVANGVIADPFVRMNELGCQWVDQADWSYRCSFEWAPKPGCPKRVLRFEGLDTVCSVFLNEELVAEHDNMFVPLEIDVTELLREGANSLRVEFQSAVRVGNERRAAYFAEHGIREDVAFFDERAFVRKAQYMFGWDWGPRLVSCGIWKPVCLIEYSARILDLHVATVLTGDDRNSDNANGICIRIRTEVEGSAEVCHRLYAYAVAWGRDVEIELDSWAKQMHLETALVYGPERDIEMTNEARSGLDMEQIATEFRVTRIGADGGIRLLRESDQLGESFEFEVDGEKIWARGANWIPDHSFPSVIDKARLRDRLEKCKDMGFNMLRVWGGGLYESDEFYDLCDELGILVWQDFPFACSYYPDTPEWQESIRKEAEVNIKRLRNHPCLALWCGNNENSEMHETRWGGDRQPPRFYGENLYDKVLPELVAELDPGRSYIPTSPVGQPSHPNPSPPEGRGAHVSPEKLRGPNSDWYGDQHNWDAWHGRGDWRFYSDSRGRFSSEYGFASSCSLPVWEKTLAPEDWDPHSHVVQWHDRTNKGHETFHGFVKLHYPEPVTLEDWVYYSQLNQRDALRHGVEHYRRSEFCAGSLIWQLNDCWPVQSWSILDSDGNYKALAYELRRLYADRLLSIERDNDKVRVWSIGHGDEPPSQVSLKAVHVGTGAVLREWAEENAPLPSEGEGPGVRAYSMSGEIRLALTADLTGLATPDTILFASARGAGTTWQLLNEPKNMRFAPALPIIASTHEEGVLKLLLRAPVVDLMLTVDGGPMPFQDNFFTSRGGDIEVACAAAPEHFEARSLSGTHRVHLTRGPL